MPARGEPHEANNNGTGRKSRGSPPPAILLVQTLAGAQRIVHRCERAAAAGVRPGMTLAHARALLGGRAVHVEPFDEARDRKALAALAAWAMRFSPLVAPDAAHGTNGLFIDITGCQRLFHGERRLVNTIANTVHWMGFRARIAVAHTYGCAWAAARFGQRERSIIETGLEQETLAPLPVEALRLEDETVDSLREVGIECIGHVLELPRLELVTRFGPDLLRRLDQATGEADETIEPIRPKEVPRVERLFNGPVKQLEAILLTVRELFTELADELQRLESGVRTLELELERSDAPAVCETIELSRPTRNGNHLWSLLRPKIETINLGFGIERITLAAIKTARLRHRQASSWRDDGHDDNDDAPLDEALGELVDTLASRLGPQRTVRIRPVESHVPERAFASQPVRGSREAREIGAAVADSERPSVLLARPEPAEVLAAPPDGAPSWMRWRGVARRIVRSVGPERIAGEWWRDDEAPAADEGAHQRRVGQDAAAAPADDPAISCLAARDYFKVQDEAGRWLWVCRELASNRWFVHGQWA
ncbi:MAG: DNA polymerase Y family protein [Planctomycetota bacterium]|nr:DNA polymerase Y family protein [Planctomycetota bacterium]